MRLDDLRFVSLLRLKICRNKKRSKRSLLPDNYRSKDGRLEMPHMALACMMSFLGST